MKKLLIMVMLAASLNAKYLVRVYVNGYGDVVKLQENGADIAASLPTKNAVDVIVMDLSTVSGFSYEILDADLEAHRAKINFGPYYTYEEAVAELDSLHARYPNIVSQKFSIGQSIEGRELWVVRISDNPEVDENEPAVFLNAAIHAREPGGVSTVFGFIHYLVRNYGVDPTVTWLINNRELYIEPVVNPDGYVYNETSDGYWRKNKRDNNHDGRFEEYEDGVDLNRNFGYMWGYDDHGSSPTPSSQVYRGTAAFSEPETDNMRIFVDSIKPRIVINYHTYSNLVIYPWGYVNQPTPDQNVYVAMAQRMTRVNGYDYGRPAELLYPVNGEANDWFYGDTIQKPRALSFVVEVGERFWQPDTNIILQQIEENIPLNMFVLEAAGLYFEVNVDSVRNQQGGININPGDTALIYLSLNNLSPFDSATNVQISATVDPIAGTVLTPYVEVSGVSTFPNGNVSCETPLRIALSNQVSSGTAVGVSFNITADNGFQQPYTTEIKVGAPETVMYETFENALADWTTTGQWGLTTSEYHSPTHSLTDSPNGSYSNNVESYAQYAHRLDLSNLRSASVVYYTKYSLESSYDFTYFEVSRDGQNWVALRSYTGTQNAWTVDTVDLNNYVGDSIYIRFHFSSDVSVTRDGFYVDDIKLIGYRHVDVAETPAVKDIDFKLNSNIFFRLTKGTLNLNLPHTTDVDISIFDVTGRLVKRQVLTNLSSGAHKIPISLPTSAGIYFMLANVGKKTFKSRFIVTGR